MKRTDLKIISGEKKESSPRPESKFGKYLDYAWMFAVSGIIWAVIGLWIWQYFSRH